MKHLIFAVGLSICSLMVGRFVIPFSPTLAVVELQGVSASVIDYADYCKHEYVDSDDQFEHWNKNATTLTGTPKVVGDSVKMVDHKDEGVELQDQQLFLTALTEDLSILPADPSQISIEEVASEIESAILTLELDNTRRLDVMDLYLEHYSEQISLNFIEDLFHADFEMDASDKRYLLEMVTEHVILNEDSPDFLLHTEAAARGAILMANDQDEKVRLASLMALKKLNRFHAEDTMISDLFTNDSSLLVQAALFLHQHGI